MDDAEDDTETPNPNPAPGQEAPARAQAPSAGEPHAAPAQEPYFVANTEADYRARVGGEQTHARQSLAKKYGFDTLEAFDQAMTRYKALDDQNKTELQRLQDRTRALESENTAFKTQRNSEALRGEVETQAKALGLDMDMLDAVNDLRPKNDGEVDAEGNANADLVKASLETVLQKYPKFKAPAPTVGGGGSPAEVAAQQPTLDQAAAQAQSNGNWRTALAAQTAKLFGG